MRFYFLAFKRGFDFSGCSCRREFWMFMLVNLFITFVFIAVDIVFNVEMPDMAYSIVSFIPMLAAIVRRLHDINKSGYWGFIFLLPVIGPFWLLYLLMQPTKMYGNGEIQL
ncbi:DUF805 domain-containing protein [Vibrio salinus]|uniref:DUF805 domain-containing protein n=1 Tax=Vibrio salinus TaxID=2899784 RepID=UPI001E51FB36|nr:DUF805 domain-containing protein [Vibrio salinus]MCE0495564.1 DUF805 domain-containing protein [Vibrio salinus]